jgi:hypothetical protein
MTLTIGTTGDLQTLRQDLAARSGRGVPAIAAGAGLWATFGFVGLILTDVGVLAVICLAGAGLLWPLGLLIARAQRLDPFARGNPLGQLAGLLGAVQILFIPVMIGVYRLDPGSVPGTLAVLVGAHLLPFAWVYCSRAYLCCSLAIVAAGAGAGAAANYAATSFLTAAVLTLTAVALRRGHR